METKDQNVSDCNSKGNVYKSDDQSLPNLDTDLIFIPEWKYNLFLSYSG